MTGPYVAVTPDPPLAARAGDDRLPRDRRRARALAQPGRRRSSDSAAEATTSGGRRSRRTGCAPRSGSSTGARCEIELADASPHALIGGPSGSGKTNLLLTMIGSLAARYSPDELALYLLDFKEGVSFAQLAPGRKAPVAGCRTPG